MDRELLEFLFLGPLFSIFKKLNAIERKFGNMATQVEVNALTEKLGAVSTQLTKGFGEITDEIQKLKDANPAIDISALSAKVDEVAGKTQALDDVVPDVVPEPTPEPSPTPEPPPEPAPEPTGEVPPENA